MAIETSKGIPYVDENDGDKAAAVNSALGKIDELLDEAGGAGKASLTEDNLLRGVQTFSRAPVQQVQGIGMALLALNHNFTSGLAPIIRIGDSQNLDTHAITGLTEGVGGLRKMVWNVSGGTLSFLSEHAGSTAENRFRLTASEIFIPSQGFAEFIYDNYSARWRLISST